MYESALNTARYPGNVEVVVYTDEDDNSYDGLNLFNMTLIKGPQLSISEAWNKCWESASGAMLGLFGDDVMFRTENWDETVTGALNEFDDHIMYVFGDDGSPTGKTFGTHGFIHQNWAKTVGYFVPPYFAANCVDTWLNDVAKALGRHRYIDHYWEHCHALMGKAEDDATYRLGRERAGRPEALYAQMGAERQIDVDKLRAVMP